MRLVLSIRLVVVCIPFFFSFGCDSQDGSLTKEISADIETPIYFVLMNEPELSSDGYFSGWNRILRQSDVDISSDRGLEPLMRIDRPTFKSVSQENWLVQAILRPLIGTGLILQKSYNTASGLTSVYRVSLGLQRTALTGDRHIDHFGSAQAFRIYNLGAFKLKSAEMINEYSGPDQRTGAETKFRSYRALVEFHPTAATGQVYNGAFPEITCTVVAGLDQASLQWQFTSDQCEVSKPQ